MIVKLNVLTSKNTSKSCTTYDLFYFKKMCDILTNML